MSRLVATAKALDANSYLTVVRANEIVRTRLYTADWDTASALPDADGYQTSEVKSAGEGSVAVDTGSGTFKAGNEIKFAGHDTIYTVSSDLAGPGTLSFSPNLTDALADNEAVERLTASDREKALIWATGLLDNLMDWYGAARTEDQALRWPRSGVLDQDGDYYDYDTIPALLEKATVELAMVLLGDDRFAQPDLLGQGFREARVGDLHVKVDQRQQEEVIPANVLVMLSPLGRLKPEGGKGARTVSLERT